MKVELDTTDLKALVKSVGVGSIENYVAMEKARQMKFTGNQHNESWAWRDDYLDKLTDAELYTLYLQYKHLT